MSLLKVLHFVFAVVTPLARKALRTHQAFRPKTRQAYDAMFKVFVAYCIVAGVLMSDVNVLFRMYGAKPLFLCCIRKLHVSHKG